MNYNALSHELRVDHTAEGDERVLTTAYKMGFYAAVKLRVKKGLTESVNWRVDRFLGVGIDAWRPEEGTLEPLYDMFDFAAPDDATWAPETTTWTKQDVSCSGGVEIDALDYHHISAVSVGPSGDMLITSRNLNTIWCVDAERAAAARPGSCGRSLLDGASDFAFERGLDMFYTPHNALELEDGRLLLIDDGSSRPGCFTSNAPPAAGRARRSTRSTRPRARSRSTGSSRIRTRPTAAPRSRASTRSRPTTTTMTTRAREARARCR